MTLRFVPWIKKIDCVDPIVDLDKQSGWKTRNPDDGYPVEIRRISVGQPKKIGFYIYTVGIRRHMDYGFWDQEERLRDYQTSLFNLIG